MSYRVGIDVGGTFTDFLIVNEESGELTLHKTPSTPDDPSRAVITGLEVALDRLSIDPAEVSHIMHGTTVATNAVLEGKGAKVGLLCTSGFEQVLHLARGETPGPLAGWVTMIKPDPLAALENTRGVAERIAADGTILEPIDLEQAAAMVDELVAAGAQALSICFLNAYANGRHEEMLRDVVADRHPDCPVSISSEILPELREYERTNIVVMNAYIRPIMETYLHALESDVRDVGVGGSVIVLRSDGGLMTARSAQEQPVHTLFSGPAGGVTGAARVAVAAGYPNFLSLDVGGTSTDVALCIDGEPVITRDTNLGYFPVKSPSIDVRSVGAGGGSIAHVPEATRALRVGPESAGADPGPACYGKGGTKATATDANLVLGYLPNTLLGGEMALDLESARNAVGEVADALGLSVEEAAEGIVDVVNENMVGALRLVSVEKGHDPREFALVAFGGAGPLHANALGELMGSFPVIVPPTPGVLAALGDVSSPFRSEFAETLIRRFEDATPAGIVARLESLTRRAEEWLEAENVAASDRVVQLSVDVRYHNQALELPLGVAADEVSAGFDDIAERFAAAHEQAYGFRLDSGCEFANLRAVAIGRSNLVTQAPAERASDSAATPVEHQQIYFGGKWLEAAVYDRSQLQHGNSLNGPAIVTQVDSTTVVHPGFVATVDQDLNLVIVPASQKNARRQAESPIVVDIIENALKNTRREMDAVIFRAAMSTVIREEHDSFPLVADDQGRMLAGQFGWPLAEFFETYPVENFEPGDVLILNDPYLCGGAIQHTPDMLVLRPIFFEEELVGFASQLGNLMDIGGAVAGSMPVTSKSIFEEGIRFPPVKLYSRGELVTPILDILARNSRTPELTTADTLALVAATRAAEQRIIEICERFGVEAYRSACQKLLTRTHEAAKLMISSFIPTEPLVFEDEVDDDGCGNGPFAIKLALWREGEKAILDFAGTAPQAEGPINLLMGEAMFKMVTGIVLIMALDPQILFNHGYNDLFEVRFPPKSLVQPEFPAPLSNRSHTLARIFDVLAGALAQQTPEMATGAACGSSPHFLFSGTDEAGEFFFFYEINYGGVPGRPIGDGLDVHAWWPNVTSIPVEYCEAYFPLRITSIRANPDSGGAGLHRGGNGVEKIYEFLASGEVSIHDDRHRSKPWGIGGGLAAMGSRKILVQKDGTRREIPSKLDLLHVEPGDRLIYITAGGGGWGDPLDRAVDAVEADVVRGLVTTEGAFGNYGVVLDETGAADDKLTDAERAQRRTARPPGPLPTFDFGRLA